MKEKIEHLHGNGSLKRSALRLPGGQETFERVVGGKGYHTVLEIGTYRGCTAAAMSQYCERVITIDLQNGQVERDGGFDRIAFWASLGLSNIEFHAVADDAEKAAFVGGLDFDFSFIDGAHDREAVSRDFEMVKRCGRVLFHDYDSSKPNHVFDFVNTLKTGKVEIIEDFALWTA